MDVLVPHAAGIAALADVPGVRAIRYRPEAPLPAEAEGAEVLVAPFNANDEFVEALGRMRALRLVQLLTAGAETWIGRLPDGVALSDGRGAHGGATAEWIVAALLAVYRHLPRFTAAQADERWDYHTTEELAAKRVLVVGAGDVAEQTVARLAPFEVTTTLVGRRARDGVHPVDEVAALLPHHDACVVVVPLTDATRGLVDAAFLAAMPDGSVLVNAARGPVVDTDALAGRADRRTAARGPRRHRSRAAARGPPAVVGARSAAHPARRRQRAAGRRSRVPDRRRADPAVRGGNTPSNLVKDGY